jgi:hypothetical protein
MEVAVVAVSVMLTGHLGIVSVKHGLLEIEGTDVP